MIRSFLSFCFRFSKSRGQVQLDIVYLRRRVEIVADLMAHDGWIPGRMVC